MSETAAEHDDALFDSLAMIECWAAVDAAEDGSQAQRQATEAMGALVSHLGNAYATSLTLAKVLSQVREQWLACPQECCQEAGPRQFREWFTGLAR